MKIDSSLVNHIDTALSGIIAKETQETSENDTQSTRKIGR